MSIDCPMHAVIFLLANANGATQLSFCSSSLWEKYNKNISQDVCLLRVVYKRQPPTYLSTTDMFIFVFAVFNRERWCAKIISREFSSALNRKCVEYKIHYVTLCHLMPLIMPLIWDVQLCQPLLILKHVVCVCVCVYSVLQKNKCLQEWKIIICCSSGSLRHSVYMYWLYFYCLDEHIFIKYTCVFQVFDNCSWFF